MFSYADVSITGIKTLSANFVKSSFALTFWLLMLMVFIVSLNNNSTSVLNKFSFKFVFVALKIFMSPNDIEFKMLFASGVKLMFSFSQIKLIMFSSSEKLAQTLTFPTVA